MGKKKRMREEAEKKPEPEPVFKGFTVKGSVILVAALVALTFALRVGSFSKEHPLSFDEQVYPFLAMQMIKAPGTYNTAVIYEDALRKGRQLPEYFNKPLFKHPPLFPWLLSEGMTMLGGGLFSAFKVSLLFGVLLIGLAYFLGAGLFGHKTGMWAAAIMFIEPVSWIVSQKIWVETTLAFFTILSLALFARSIRKYNPWFVLASGAAAGLAALCKYPGMLATGAVVVYALLADRALFRKKTFLASLLIPFVMLIPWFIWNYKVYGPGLLSANIEIVHLNNRLLFLISKTWWVFAASAVIAGISFGMRDRIRTFYEGQVAPRSTAIAWVTGGIAAAAVFASIAPGVIKAFDWNNLPEAGWKMNMFLGAPWHFYLGRLVELSPFYILSFAGLLMFAADGGRRKEWAFLYIASFLLLGLYVLWGNYQCRYITAVTVPFIVISAGVLAFLYEKTKVMRPALKYAVIAACAVFIVYAAAKTLRMDILLAVPNNVCYF